MSYLGSEALRLAVRRLARFALASTVLLLLVSTVPGAAGLCGVAGDDPADAVCD